MALPGGGGGGGFVNVLGQRDKTNEERNDLLVFSYVYNSHTTAAPRHTQSSNFFFFLNEPLLWSFAQL